MQCCQLGQSLTLLQSKYFQLSPVLLFDLIYSSLIFRAAMKQTRSKPTSIGLMVAHNELEWTFPIVHAWHWDPSTETLLECSVTWCRIIYHVLNGIRTSQFRPKISAKLMTKKSILLHSNEFGELWLSTKNCLRRHTRRLILLEWITRCYLDLVHSWRFLNSLLTNRRTHGIPWQSSCLAADRRIEN